MTNMCLDFLLVLIQSRLLSFSLLLLYCKGWKGIILVFYEIFVWRTHYRPLSHIPSSSNWRCLRIFHMLCCRNIFGNIFLLCVSRCMRPWVFFVFLTRRHLQWISSTILSFRLIVCFPYGLRRQNIGVNIYWLTVWKISGRY